MIAPCKESYDQARQHIKKQRHYFANNGLSSQSYGFSSSQVWMWELDYKESWVLKNWCFWTVVLEKTLESPLERKEIQPVLPMNIQDWFPLGLTGWSTNESRVLGEISITSDTQMTHLYSRMWRRTKDAFDESERREWKSLLKAQHSEN